MFLVRQNWKIYFLRLMFLFASFWAGISEPTGKGLIFHSSNLELHNSLHFISVVFDNFPEGFYAFMDWVKYQNDPDFETSPQRVKKYNRPDKEKDSMKIFSDTLLYGLNLPQFDSIYEAYREYLAFGDEGYLPRAYFYADPEVLRKIFIRVIKSENFVRK